MEKTNYSIEREENIDQGHLAADAILNPKKESDLEKIAELSNEIDFVKEVQRLQVNINDPYAHIDTKRKLIREYTLYTKLNGEGKSKKTLSQAAETSRLGLAFKNIYNSYLNKIEKAFS